MFRKKVKPIYPPLYVELVAALRERALRGAERAEAESILRKAEGELFNFLAPRSEARRFCDSLEAEKEYQLWRKAEKERKEKELWIENRRGLYEMACRLFGEACRDVDRILIKIELQENMHTTEVKP